MGERGVAQPRADRGAHQDRQYLASFDMLLQEASGRGRAVANAEAMRVASQGNPAADAAADATATRIMPPEESTPAIVLRARDYSESDRIVTLLTRDAGKLGGIAKGAKASRRRFERKLEPFSHVMLYFRRRRTASWFSSPAPRRPTCRTTLDDDLGKIALGSYMLELADALTREESEAARGLSRIVGRPRRARRCGRGRGAAAGIRVATAAMGGLRPGVRALPDLRESLSRDTARRCILSWRAAAWCARDAVPGGRGRDPLRARSAAALARLCARRSTNRPARSRRGRRHARARALHRIGGGSAAALADFSIRFCPARARPEVTRRTRTNNSSGQVSFPKGRSPLSLPRLTYAAIRGTLYVVVQASAVQIRKECSMTFHPSLFSVPFGRAAQAAGAGCGSQPE